MNIVVREYLSNKIEFKMINGEVYANATSFNEPQKLKDWKRSNKTKELIEELSKVENSHITKELIFSERGQGENSGTWIHETLVLDFAQYISVRFRVWVQKQIATLLREGNVSLKTPSYQIVDPIERAKKWIEEEEERRRLAIENDKKEKVIAKQKNTIHDLTSDIDTVVLRKTFTDYVNKVVRSTSSGYAEVYNKIYSIVGRVLKKDLKLALEKFKVSEKEKVNNNKIYNKENNLKGNDRVFPYKYSDSKANISMVEYIIDILEEAQRLIETVASVCEVGVDEILDTYQMFRDEEMKMLDY